MVNAVKTFLPCFLYCFCACSVSIADETEANDIRDLKTWPAELQAAYDDLSKVEQDYVLNMLRQSWPASAAGPEGTMFVLDYDLRVSQIVSKSAFIGRLTAEELVWVDDVDTEDLVDDSVVRCRSLVFVSAGNERYTTVLGASKTVRKVRAFDASKANSLIQDVLSERGLRLFRLQNVSKQPWVIAEISSVSKLAATIVPVGEKRSWKLEGRFFSEDDQAWLAAKENYLTLKSKRRAFEAASKN